MAIQITVKYKKYWHVRVCTNVTRKGALSKTKAIGCINEIGFNEYRNRLLITHLTVKEYNYNTNQ